MESLGKHPQSQKVPWLAPQSLRSVDYCNVVYDYDILRRKRRKKRRMIWKRCRVDCKLSEVKAKGRWLICYGVIKIGHEKYSFDYKVT